MEKVKSTGFILLALFITHFSLQIPGLEAQEVIAMHPFRATSEAENMSNLFFQRLRQELPTVSDGDYRDFLIDLTRLPADVPEGGFPPWICPSPSITADSAFALTGEASPDEDFPGSFRIRVYLWRMEGARLLGSDETTVATLEDLNTLPYFLDWILSWIEDGFEPTVVYTEAEPIIVYAGTPYEHKWLYLGLRGGGGYSRWTYDYRHHAKAGSNGLREF